MASPHLVIVRPFLLQPQVHRVQHPLQWLLLGRLPGVAMPKPSAQGARRPPRSAPRRQRLHRQLRLNAPPPRRARPAPRTTTQLCSPSQEHLRAPAREVGHRLLELNLPTQSFWYSAHPDCVGRTKYKIQHLHCTTQGIFDVITHIYR